MNKKIWLLSFAIALGLQMQAQRQDDMRQTVEYLASQELGGRYPATHGDTLASEFIVSQLRSMKLKPIVKGKKETGYYHNFTYGKNEKREEREANYSQHHRRDSRKGQAAEK